MFRNIFVGLCLLGLVPGFTLLGPIALASPAVRAAEATPTSQVERFYAVLTDNMKQGKTLGFEGRRNRLDPVVRAVFDLPAMVRISTGAGWGKMSDAEKDEVLKAFAAWTVANYAGNFADDDGLKFEIKSQSPEDAKGNVMVNTQLNVKGEPPVLFNYRFHKVGDTWQIFDIYLDGAISQLATRRAEFAAVLGKGTAADLVTHMKRLTKDAEKGPAAAN